MRKVLLLSFAVRLAAAQHIVLIAGDEEYRSEESLPQLAKILSTRHGFTTTVLYAIDKHDGTINPNQRDNIPGLEALDHAGLMIIAVRWRDLPDEQMKHLVDYIESGRPIIGLRTATHSFDLKSPTYQRYTWNSKEWDGGFGRQVLGETWVRHHGQHGKQSTRGLFAPGAPSHPILRGIEDASIWGPTDVYAVANPLPADSKPLVLGQVLTGMQSRDPPVDGPQNNPMMPVAWTKTYKGARVFTTTMGASQDLLNESFRRMLVNACYWALGKDVPAKADVRIVGTYEPAPFKFDGFKRGMRP